MQLSFNEIVEIIKIALGGGALYSVWIAQKAYKANLVKQEDDRIRDSDKEILNQSEKSLEWAYEVLTDAGKNLPPRSDRLNWLTCARHMTRHDELASKIKTVTYQTVHAEIEEFWRHRFYVALHDLSLSKSSYFGSTDTFTSDRQIEPVSALVVLRFARWKKSAVDPLDVFERATLVGNGDVFKSAAGRGLQSYLYELENYRKRRAAPATVTSEAP